MFGAEIGQAIGILKRLAVAGERIADSLELLKEDGHRLVVNTRHVAINTQRIAGEENVAINSQKLEEAS